MACYCKNTKWETGAFRTGSAPNIISHNLGFGVEVTGVGSHDNSILANSIYVNELGGIRTVNSGNREIPPPIEVSYSGGNASGPSIRTPGMSFSFGPYRNPATSSPAGPAATVPRRRRGGH